MRLAVVTALIALSAAAVAVTPLWHAAPAPAVAQPSVQPATLPPAPSSVIGPDEDTWPEQAPSPEQVLYRQPALLQAALAGLTPRVSGQPNLYLLAFAGDGSENVFGNEAEYAARLFTRRFGPSAHALVLENNPDTLDSRPLATWSNLEVALDGLARVMHPERDILLLYLTSHGSPDHYLLVDMDPLPLDQIGARDLGAILARRPFQWKVVVVNACYSGGFIPALRGPGTMVLTAARGDRSSFGCGSDSDITYFGRAWLVDALNRTDDPARAFEDARDEIARWETRDRLTPSRPQIAVGAGIERQLARWRRTVSPRPPLPFQADHGSAGP